MIDDVLYDYLQLIETHADELTLALAALVMDLLQDRSDLARSARSYPERGRHAGFPPKTN